jgi:hypothetical protein
MKRKKKPVQILTCGRAQKIVDGVIWYGTALSRSRGTRMVHGLVARKQGRKLAITCSCEAGLHYRWCGHITAFAVRIKRAMKRAAHRRIAA